MIGFLKKLLRKRPTRDEFIDAYMARSELPAEYRTSDGFECGGIRRVALPCDCGEPGCDGWQMGYAE